LLISILSTHVRAGACAWTRDQEGAYLMSESVQLYAVS